MNKQNKFATELILNQDGVSADHATQRLNKKEAKHG